MLILSIGALYAGVVLALAPCRGFWSGDAGVKLWQMKAWIANNWRTPSAPYADVNATLDPHHHFAPLEPPFTVWEGSQVVTIYTLPCTFISSLLLAKWGRLALYALPLVAGVAGLTLAMWMGRRFSNLVAWLAPPVLGLATPWLFYSVVFWEHTVASLLVWIALALLLLNVDVPLPRSTSGVAAGLCLGVAMVARPETSVCVLVLVVVLVVQQSAWPSLGWLVVGLGLAGLAGWIYQANIVGQTTIDQVTMNFTSSVFELWSIARLFETSQMVVESRHLGVLMTLLGAIAAFGLAWVYRVLFPDTGALLGRIAECIGLILVAVSTIVLLLRGHNPIDLLTGVPVVCFLAMRGADCAEIAPSQRRWKRQLAAWCVLVVVLSVVLAPNDGGRQWGPRYLTPVLGPIILLSVETWERLERGARCRLSRHGARAAFVALTLAGVVTQGVGVAKLRHVRGSNDALSRSLLSPPSAAVISDLWFVPQIAPEVYGQVPFFVVRTADEWRELDDRLAAQGVERVRVVRLTGQEDPLVESITARWRVLEDTLVEAPTIPPLSIADYVPQEP